MPSSIPVLCYHNVQETDGHSPAMFAEHLHAIVAQGFRTITALQLLEWMTGKRRLDGRCCVLTFDDGHVSNWTTVAPMLREHGLHGVFFVNTDFLRDGPARTPAEVGEPAPLAESFRRALRDGDHSQFVNTAEARALVQDYGFEVHSHGRRHQGCFAQLSQHGNYHAETLWSIWGIYPYRNPRFPAFKVHSAYANDGFWPEVAGDGPAQGTDGDPEPWFKLRSPEERRAFLRADLAESLEAVRAINGGGPQFFCWPWGEYDAVGVQEAERAGYAGAFSLERYANTKGGDPMRIHRLGVARNKDGRWLASRLKLYANPVAARALCKFYRPWRVPRRVLFITDSMKLSGGSRQLLYNAQALARMRLDVAAAVPPASPLAGALVDAGVEVLPFEDFKSPLAVARFLRRTARERDIDVVHTFHNKAYKGAILARLLGARFKLFLNRGVIFRPNALIGLWSVLASGVVANSFACSRVLERHLAPAGRISVVYNAFDASAIPRRDPATRTKRGLRFVWVGNAAHAKAPEIFLQAADLFCKGGDARDVEFVLCGLDDLERFRDAAGQAYPRITSLGTVPHARVLEQMAMADAFVSSSRLESMPNTLLEAFSLSLPVAATDVGGTGELVADGVTGLLVPPEDPAALAEAMRRLADDFDARVRMGRAGRTVVERLLCPQRKGRELVRVYMGETVRVRPRIRPDLKEFVPLEGYDD